MITRCAVGALLIAQMALANPIYEESKHKDGYENHGYGVEGGHHDKHEYRRAAEQLTVARDYGSEKSAKASDYGGYDKYDAAHHHSDDAHSGFKKGSDYEAAQKHGGNTHAKENSNFDKDVKTKSYGYFDYQYVQPQYHMEKFHVDEKHAGKYGADSHDYGSKYYGSGDHHNGAYDKYGKGYGSEGAQHSGYGSEKHGHDSKYGKYGSGYQGDHADYYNAGHGNFGSDYDSHHKEQQYEPHYGGYGYGYAPHYGH